MIQLFNYEQRSNFAYHGSVYDRLPKKKSKTNQATQQKVFQEFWDIYDRHYPLMHRKNIDWQSIHATYYPQITNTTTDSELLAHFQDIMQHVIKDGHTVVMLNQQEATYEPSNTTPIVQTMLNQNTPNLVTYVGGSATNEYLSYGTLNSNSNIGYIKSKRFEPLNDNFDGEFIAFKAIVDAALNFLQNKIGIIVDVRTNGGGQGPFAFYLAGRFVTTGSPMTLTRQRVKEQKGSTIASMGPWLTQDFEGYPDSRGEYGYVAGVLVDDFRLSSSGSFQYNNKVAVFTAQETASAAEYFTLAMKTQTKVRSIGNTTFGIFAGSDFFTLRNGGGKWKTNISVQDAELLSNGSYQSFEGIGIVPDELVIPTNTEVAAGKDVHLEAALNYLN